MTRQIYVLQAGINEYPANVSDLRGCLNDVQAFRDFLTGEFSDDVLHIETLTNSDATRENIIDGFRTHLGQAGKDDVAVFQYCGHGAQQESAPEFKEFYPEGKDEGLVCVDSRSPGGHDLADKELAVLLNELAHNDPHIAVILDCCHSGSATRGADDLSLPRHRQAPSLTEPRPLDTYLDGHYADLSRRGERLMIPASRHIALAACDRKQKAWETKKHTGLFSMVLGEVLEASGRDLSYADLFMRLRAAVVKYADDQDPQFDTYMGFNAYGGFLGGQGAGERRRFSVRFDKGWVLDAGAIHGLPSAPEKRVGLEVFDRAGEEAIGAAHTARVGAQTSALTLEGFEADESSIYEAEVTDLPVPPLPIFLEGEEAGVAALTEALAKDLSTGVAFVGEAKGVHYGVRAESGAGEHAYVLTRFDPALTREVTDGSGFPRAAETMLSILARVAHYERVLGLQNAGTQLDPERVDFRLTVNRGEEGREYSDDAGELTVVLKADEGVPARFHARNGTDRDLHFALLYLSKEFGVKSLYNNPVPAGESVTLYDGGPRTFFVEEGLAEADENFRLFVSEKPIQQFLLEQEDVPLRTSRGFGDDRGFAAKVADDWFTRAMHVRTLRADDAVSAEKDATLAGGAVVVKAHDAFQAQVSLSSPSSGSRSVDASIPAVLAAYGLHPLELDGGGSRDVSAGGGPSIIELTDIQNDDALADHPLEIDLGLELDEDAALMPLVFDGEHVLLGADVTDTGEGGVRLTIDRIPDSVVPDGRRSLGKSLKLYLFRVYLKRDPDSLCWVEYKEDGTLERRSDGVADRVAGAKNILLLVHGIIGDTKNIAAGIPDAVDGSGQSVRDLFDLVLTYDYENLGRSIKDTAADLAATLATAGLDAKDDARLTLLAHSMGGLVARCFIEQLGGNQVVDHLVMCGTPNGGSAFGEVGKARKLLQLLTAVSLNVPVLGMIAPALAFVLNRSKKVTVTLEEMDNDSDVIRGLANAADPGVRYSILAGNAHRYQEESDGLFAKLLEKAGHGLVLNALHGTGDHDIAVTVEHIREVPREREPAPISREVVCHHLNYFASSAGLKALGEVDWAS